MADAHKNFAYSTVATAPSPADTGVSLIVQAGDGAKFPTPPFNATVWPAGVLPITTNAEIIRVTAISTDTLTITRIQESTSARSIVIGDQIAATITNKTLTDIENLLPTGTIVGTTDAQTLTNKTLSDVFMGETLQSLSATLRSITLTASTNFRVDESVKIGSSFSLKIPSTSTLKIVPAVKRGAVDFNSLLSTIFSGQVQSMTNTDTAGGTIYYVNLGGIKIAWGLTASITVTGVAPATTGGLGITWPTGFFTTIQTAMVSATPGLATSSQYVYAAPNTAVTTTSWSFFLVSTNGSNGATSQASFIAIGT